MTDQADAPLPSEPLAALREAIAQLDRQIGRAGREQFKANALAEAQQQTLAAAVAQLRAAAADHEREAGAWREQLAEARARERLELIRDLLPTLDGLGEALAAGRRLTAARPEGLGPRLRRAWEALRGRDEAAPALVAWLDGLAYVEARLLALLAAEGIRRIRAEGEPFDPHQHVVIEVVPAEAGQMEGQVIRELRQGYRRGAEVLRYAEVAVAKPAAGAPDQEAE